MYWKTSNNAMYYFEKKLKILYTALIMNILVFGHDPLWYMLLICEY